MPQVALFTVLTWMAEARSFHHQQRLSQDVARLLVGEQATTPVAEKVARVQENVPPPRTPATPAAAVMKKIELSLETIAEAPRAALFVARLIPGPQRQAESRRSEPAHGPPRGRIV